MPQSRDWHGRFVSHKQVDSPGNAPSLIEVTTFKKPKLKSEIPPIVDLKITNPVTYIKLWWRKVMSGEGISIRIHPVTAILIAISVTGGSFFLGRYLQLRSDLIEKYIPQFAGINSIDAAFSGTLYAANGQYFLTQGESQAVRIKPNVTDMSPYLSQRVFVSGKFDPLTRQLNLTTINLSPN